MKKLKDFLKLLIAVQLGTCFGFVLSRYMDYRKHPGLYEMNSAPWYTGIQVTLLATVVGVALTAIAYWFVCRRMKQKSGKQ